MKDFIINLYANKYFPIYLGVVIIVLLIAFFIVFFLGKKDQKKIEETQKLNLEKLKEAQNSSNISNTEVKPTVQNISVQNTPVEPKVQTEVTPVVSVPTNTAPEVKPVTVNPTIQTLDTPVVEPVKVTPVAPVMEVKTEVPVTPKVVETQVQEVPPVIPPVMEIKPTIENTKPVIDEDVYRVNKKEEETVNRLKELSSSLDKEMKNLETKPLVTPEVQKETTEKPKVMNVYSSVYVPNNNVVTPVKEKTPVVENNDDDLDDTMEIELPKLKTEEPILKDNSSDPLNLL